MKKNTLLLTVVAGLIFACSTPTQITARWKDPETHVGYKDVFVAGLTHNALSKQAFESNMAKELKAKGVQCTKSVDLFPYVFTNENRPDKEMILTKVRENGNDAILTFALLKQKEEVHYVPGSTSYAPYGGAYGGYYGSFGGYYGAYGGRMYDPGYYTSDDIYFIETNMYDAKTEKLIWSAQSKTYNPTDIESFSKEVTHAAMYQLMKDSLLSSSVK